MLRSVRDALGVLLLSATALMSTTAMAGTHYFNGELCSVLGLVCEDADLALHDNGVAYVRVRHLLGDSTARATWRYDRAEDVIILRDRNGDTTELHRHGTCLVGEGTFLLLPTRFEVCLQTR
ncbi:MAG: hypothetical protein H6733_09405 [Alphaproteobacteria bacterium]|nr:hypothetical protein [Alphaproteobacteria bacterium]